MSYRDLADLNIVTGHSTRTHKVHRPKPETDHRARALLIDDSNATRNLLARILQSTPVDVIAEASSAADALRLTAELLPDIVILDALAPGVRDSGTLERLRQVHPTVRIVLSTTLTSKRARAARAAPKADEYILRPYHRDRVRECVTKLCHTLN